MNIIISITDSTSQPSHATAHPAVKWEVDMTRMVFMELIWGNNFGDIPIQKNGFSSYSPGTNTKDFLLSCLSNSTKQKDRTLLSWVCQTYWEFSLHHKFNCYAAYMCELQHSVYKYSGHWILYNQGIR